MSSTWSIARTEKPMPIVSKKSRYVPDDLVVDVLPSKRNTKKNPVVKAKKVDMNLVR